VQEVLPGFGASLVLTATGATTAWVEQRVAGIDPDAWYEASAVLAPIGGVEAAWLRIAWYASDDASGAQIGTDDSPVVASPPANAMSHDVQLVGTGPVQPPIEAASARIRILVRPTSQAGGSVAIDDIEFRPTEPLTPVPPPAPATPEVTPASAATPSAAPSAFPTPVPAASPPASSAPTAGTAAPLVDAAVDPAMEAAQRWLRISELMPDPVQSGGDADYEWIEIVNLGPSCSS
jgi:hypothetical protein